MSLISHHQEESCSFAFPSSCMDLELSLESEAVKMVLLRQQQEDEWPWETPTWQMSFLEPRETLINVNGETSFKT